MIRLNERILARGGSKPAILGLLMAGLLLASSSAFAASTPVTACGQVLSAPGNYHLTGNIGPCVGHGIEITGSKVILTLSGFTISGVSSTESCDLDNPQYGLHIQAPATGVKVSGGTVTGFVDGIVLYSSSSRASAMTVTNNCAFGIAVSGTKNIVDTSLVTGSGIDGVGVVEASDVTIQANHLFDNSRYGVLISAFSDGNTVQSNIMQGNGVAVGAGGGVLIANGNANVIQDNAAIGNFDGISLGESVTGTIIRRNTANGNVSTGIAVSGGSTPNSISANTARGNGTADMSDANPGCGANVWKNKLFGTDLVAGVSDGGPSGGCIK